MPWSEFPPGFVMQDDARNFRLWFYTLPVSQALFFLRTLIYMGHPSVGVLELTEASWNTESSFHRRTSALQMDDSERHLYLLFSWMCGFYHFMQKCKHEVIQGTLPVNNAHQPKAAKVTQYNTVGSGVRWTNDPSAVLGSSEASSAGSTRSVPSGAASRSSKTAKAAAAAAAAAAAPSDAPVADFAASKQQPIVGQLEAVCQGLTPLVALFLRRFRSGMPYGDLELLTHTPESEHLSIDEKGAIKLSPYNPRASKHNTWYEIAQPKFSVDLAPGDQMYARCEDVRMATPCSQEIVLQHADTLLALSPITTRGASRPTVPTTTLATTKKKRAIERV